MQSSDGKEWTEVYRGAELSHKVGNLNADTRYWFKVAACNAFGMGKPTPCASVVTQPPRSVNSKKQLASVLFDDTIVERDIGRQIVDVSLERRILWDEL
jgi:hypothetical protein